MSALATLLVRKGDVVTGADRTLGTPNIRFLESLGVRVFPDDGSGVTEDTGEIVVSTAIEATNRGLIRARALGIPVVHRAAALSRALADRKLIAVVGTCGKSTVTAMLGHVLAECGLDPLCVNGANVPGWEGAVRCGAGEYAVAEVDESDKSLVAFTPYAAIVTNASADHYSKEEMDAVFDAFIAHLPGPLVDGRRLPQDEVATSLPGRHNRLNAALALKMAVAIGCDETRARKALMTFGGVERRLQCHGTRVYDDYAHNPEKLHAMLTTLKEHFAGGGVCVIWRPHGYAPLRKMLGALAQMFRETLGANDRLLLLPVYDAGGTTDRSIRSEDLAAQIDERVTTVADLDAAHDWCVAHAGDYDCFVTCGARDPGLPVLAERLSHDSRILRAPVAISAQRGVVKSAAINEALRVQVGVGKTGVFDEDSSEGAGMSPGVSILSSTRCSQS